VNNHPSKQAEVKEASIRVVEHKQKGDSKEGRPTVVAEADEAQR
jgi:hypothetical protein